MEPKYTSQAAFRYAENLLVKAGVKPEMARRGLTETLGFRVAAHNPVNDVILMSQNGPEMVRVFGYAPTLDQRKAAFVDKDGQPLRVKVAAF